MAPELAMASYFTLLASAFVLGIAAFLMHRAGDLATLRERLVRAESAVQRLHRELAEAKAASGALDAELREADASRERLRAELGSVSAALESERPFLDVRLEPLGSIAG